jgi:hypothetical protein
MSREPEFLVKENYSPRFYRRLYELNSVALSCVDLNENEGIAENIFYNHLELNNAWALPNRSMCIKRVRAQIFSRKSKKILEIGFNAGRSALLMLEHNPNLNLVCIDICEHNYTIPCFEYLKKIYGNRIRLIKTSSESIGECLKDQKFGGFHIDGAKHLYQSDIAQSKLLSDVISYFLIDDTNQAIVKKAIQMELPESLAQKLDVTERNEPINLNLTSELYKYIRVVFDAMSFSQCLTNIKRTGIMLNKFWRNYLSSGLIGMVHFLKLAS